MSEFLAFVAALVRNWTARMSGVFSILLTVVGFFIPAFLVWIFGVLCLFAFFIACFHVWRDQYREARPYEEETFRHWQSVFALLSGEEKAGLEQLAIQKIVSADKVPAALEESGFVARDFTTAMCSIKSDLSLIVPRLVKEWRKNQPTQS